MGKPDACQLSDPLDADAQLLAEAILQNAAEAKAMAASSGADNSGDCIGLHRDGGKEFNLRAKMRNIRAMQRGNWKPRFQIGDIVECKYKAGWSRATVVQHRYREPDW